MRTRSILALFVLALGAVSFVALELEQPRRAEAGLFNPGVTGTVAPGQIPYTALAHRSTPGVVAGENAFYWDATNDRLGVNTAGAPTYPLDVRRNSAGLDVLNVRNEHASGLSTIRFEDEDGGAAALAVGTNNSTSLAYINRGDGIPLVYLNVNSGGTSRVSGAVTDDTVWTGEAEYSSVFAWGNYGAHNTGKYFEIVPPALASPVSNPTIFRVQGAAHTGLVAGQQADIVQFQLAQTLTYAQGALANFRAIIVNAPTLAFNSASTATNAATMVINAAPIAGANATLTDPYALWIDSGKTRLDGGITGFNDQFETATAATTDATVTTCGSFTPTDNRVVQVTAFVTGRRSTGAEGAGYELAATFRVSSGTVTQIGTTTAVTSHEDVAGWNATIDTSGGAIRGRVTGAASTTNAWDCRFHVRYVQ